MRQFIAILLLGIITAAPIKSSVPNEVVHEKQAVDTTELSKFLHHMGQRESNNKHWVTNRFGMLGRYQFSPRTIKYLGFDVDSAAFLANPQLQDSIMVRYMRANNVTLASVITRYEGRKYKGVYITRAGILAAAHLTGAGNVQRFFSDPYDMYGRSDANGTTLRDYLEEFNKYNLTESF